MVKRTNYKQEKRLKELEKQKKKEAKKERKASKSEPLEDSFEQNDLGDLATDEEHD